MRGGAVPELAYVYTQGSCKTWTGLDYGLDYGLDCGLDSGLDCMGLLHYPRSVYSGIGKDFSVPFYQSEFF